jgi:hypothetical protein
MRFLFGLSLLAALLGAAGGCVERRSVTVLFTSDEGGRLRPAG